MNINKLNETLTYRVLASEVAITLLTSERKTTTKLLWMYLYNRSDFNDQTVFHNTQRYARDMKVTVQTIRSCIRELKAYGWLESVSKGREEFLKCTLPDDFKTESKPRQESEKRFEKNSRTQHKDNRGNNLFASYENRDGTKVIIVDDSVNFEKAVTTLKRNLSTSSENSTQQPRKSDVPILINTLKLKTTLCDKILNKIHDQIFVKLKGVISAPVNILKEVVFAVKNEFVGKPKDKKNPTEYDVMHYNTCCALKLVRENKWRTPRGCYV